MIWLTYIEQLGDHWLVAHSYVAKNWELLRVSFDVGEWIQFFPKENQSKVLAIWCEILQRLLLLVGFCHGKTWRTRAYYFAFRHLEWSIINWSPSKPVKTEKYSISRNLPNTLVARDNSKSWINSSQLKLSIGSHELWRLLKPTHLR